MDFGVLGPVEIRDGSRVVLAGSVRERFILAMLLLNADRVVARDRLINALWQDPPASAKAQLHNMISKLRGRLAGHELIVTRPAGYELLLGPHRLDLLTFRQSVERGRRAAAEGAHRQAAALLSDAASLWRGPALADIPDELVGSVRQPLHEERLSAVEAQLEVDLLLGRHEDVLREMAGLLPDHPYRERLYEIQLVALVHAGRQADALEVYQCAYRRLVDDLGVEPGPSLRDLQQRILRGQMPTTTRFPASRPIPRELPPAPALLTGRSKLIGSLSDVLLRHNGTAPTVALLTGPSGVGKTAVAIGCAHELAEAFPDGQLYADLRGTYDRPADAHTVLGRFLHALGVDGSAVPEDHDERIAMYRSMMAGSQMLVLLDDAADEEQLRPLIPGAARCGVLVTSRRELTALVGAARWTVPVLSEADAVELAARIIGWDRVAAAPEATAQIVHACGRLPLAISIAAARLAARPDWTLEEFRDRLVEERDRLDELSVGDLDVRVSIGLSYRMLTPGPRRLFRRLGLVNAPSWPQWVADVCAGGERPPAAPTARLLDQLIDVHLVEPVGRDLLGQRRFRLHDLVAAFAAERAEAEDPPQEQDKTQSTVLSGWLGLATEADKQIPHDMVRAPDLETAPPPGDAAPLARDMPREWFESERRNLVFAVEHACRLDLPHIAGPLALRVAGFLGLRSYNDDWDRVLYQAILCVRRHGHTQLLTPLLAARFIAGMRRDRFGELADIATEELSVARRLDDRAAQVRALVHVGMAAVRLCRFAAAVEALEQAVTGARNPDVAGSLRGDALDALAFVCMTTGRPERALPLLQEALDIDRVATNALQTSLHLYHYGMALTDAGRAAEAEAPLAEALRTAREVGNDLRAAYLEQALADVCLRQGRITEAAERLDRARQTHEHIGDGDGLAETQRSTADLAAAEGRWADAVTWLHRALDIWQRIDSRIEIARTLARLERAHLALSNQEYAQTCHSDRRYILDQLDLDDACLYLPPFYPCFA
ncbi:AfsR/SARP family transcriptional regulator [Allorhizocola rhizosphaerae]|uniref:AfsR/SARP family transcriptional regulator n=1 Tax=Allorhizocola rhizosphaerae TaxID=1872709 RepID=UPI0013C2C5E6|nr:BTAD domain-containing putative transcriptional regulator [Allorhizocola rhizosphaerae]